MEISHGPQLFFDPALLDLARKRRERFRRGVARLERLENRLRREHSALDRRVNALEALRIQQAGRIADDQPAVHILARHGIPAAVGNRLRAVAHQLAAFENALEERMRLVFLKRFVRIEARIVIFEADHHADRNAIVRQPVEPSAAIHAGIERPAQRVRDISRLDAPRRELPKAP